MVHELAAKLGDDEEAKVLPRDVTPKGSESGYLRTLSELLGEEQDTYFLI